MIVLLILLPFVCLVGSCFGADVVCQDDDGNAVDWYYAYKLPRNKTGSNENIANGVAYAYLLSTQVGELDWTLSSEGIDSEESMMGRTLSPIYSDSRDPDLTFVMYSDQRPDGNTSSSKGHSKGVLAFDRDGGFWMVQSVPKYPAAASGPYTYPKSGRKNGQSFLCITINLDQMENIGIQFQYSTPNVFDNAMPSWAEEQFPNLIDAVVYSKRARKEPLYTIVDIISNEGVTFTSFAKHRNYGQDVYADLTAPSLETNLYVETWNQGGAPMPSECSPYEVFNVDAVSIPAIGYTFDNRFDHSKWAVAPLDSANPWVCVGDINRMEPQKKRAGVTVCQKSTEGWSAFSKSVAAIESCSG